ncbi:MAG: 4-hydroxybenzoate octaprenyltransferase [Pseudomonadales bacterium]|nr:4-hydroxybenzoate octaprenyltransferase [Pseudomonadales bacterium]
MLARFPKLPFLLAVARLDRPIGIYLLLWPTLWALWIAAEGFPGWHLFLVFTLGTVLTRSAGCIINDVADRHFDGGVKRTQGRPLVTGKISVIEALGFMLVLLFVSLTLVLTTNWPTVGLAFAGAIVAGVYPFMKRYTHLPQVILGIAFSFGIPMAFTATSNDIPHFAWLIVIANLLWTVAYDTAYAMVDRDDDLKLGIKSSAILLGDMDKAGIGALQVCMILTLSLLLKHTELGLFFTLSLAAASASFVYQQYLIRDRDRDACFRAFLSNHWTGLIIFVGIFADYL